MSVVGFMDVKLKSAPLGGVRDLIIPGLRYAEQNAGRHVIYTDVRVNVPDDRLELIVVHELVTGTEIQRNDYKKWIMSRVRDALLVDKMPDRRRITVERRSFLARAARIAKQKPRKVRQKGSNR